MDINERKKLVWAMEVLARSVNDEEAFMYWLGFGVADEDVNTDLSYEEVDDYYTEDSNFEDLMTVFLRLMKMAYKCGGLYCDGICGGER